MNSIHDERERQELEQDSDETREDPLARVEQTINDLQQDVAKIHKELDAVYNSLKKDRG